MKRVIVSLVASMFICASAYAADTAAPMPSGETQKQMTEEECKEAAAKCDKADPSCAGKLVMMNGCKPEVVMPTVPGPAQ